MSGEGIRYRLQRNCLVHSNYKSGCHFFVLDMVVRATRIMVGRYRGASIETMVGAVLPYWSC